jgi:hypothetical protein
MKSKIFFKKCKYNITSNDDKGPAPVSLPQSSNITSHPNSHNYQTSQTQTKAHCPTSTDTKNINDDEIDDDLNDSVIE